ncbi:hypothetical protein OC834_005241 [Tilletia horrida]|nr:hypothetical protein OC834_005241 [Tilletia horrida]
MDNPMTRAALRTAISFSAPHGSEGDRRKHAKAVRFATLADWFITRRNLHNVPVANALQLREAVIVILSTSVPKFVDQERVKMFHQAIDHLLTAGIVAALLEHANSMDTDPDDNLLTEHLCDIETDSGNTPAFDVNVQNSEGDKNNKTKLPNIQGDITPHCLDNGVPTSQGNANNSGAGTDVPTVQDNSVIIALGTHVSTVQDSTIGSGTDVPAAHSTADTAMPAPITTVLAAHGDAVISAPDTGVQTVPGDTTMPAPINTALAAHGDAVISAPDTGVQTVPGDTTMPAPITTALAAHGDAVISAPGTGVQTARCDAATAHWTPLPGAVSYTGFEDFFNLSTEQASNASSSALDDIFLSLLNGTSPGATPSEISSSVFSSLQAVPANQAPSQLQPTPTPTTSPILGHSRTAAIAALKQVLADQLRAVATTRSLLQAYETDSDASSTTVYASIDVSDPNDSGDLTLVEDAQVESDAPSPTANKSFDFVPQSGKNDILVADDFVPASKILNKPGVQRRKGKHVKNIFGWTMSTGRNQITAPSNKRRGGASSALLLSSMSPSSVPVMAAISAPSTSAAATLSTPGSVSPSMLLASAPPTPSSPASMAGASPQISMSATSPPFIAAYSALAALPPAGGAMHRALGYSLQQYPLGVGIRRLLAVLRHQATKEPANGPERQMLDAYVQHYQGRAAAERIINDASAFVNFAVRKYPGEKGEFDQLYLVDVELPYFAIRQAQKKWHPTLGLTTPSAIALAALSAPFS